MCSGLGKFFIPWGRRSVPWVPHGSPSLPTREHGNTSTICRFQFKVPFSSAVHPQEGGGQKRNDEGSAQRPKPECRDPSEKEKRGRKDGAPQKGGRRAPEERGGRRGAENSHPHQEMVVVRGQEGSTESATVREYGS